MGGITIVYLLIGCYLLYLRINTKNHLMETPIDYIVGCILGIIYLPLLKLEELFDGYTEEVTTWNKITDINDLPKVRGKYHVCKNGKYVGVNASYRREDMLQYSHWCEILKPENPDE